MEDNSGPLRGNEDCCFQSKPYDPKDLLQNLTYIIFKLKCDDVPKSDISTTYTDKHLSKITLFDFVAITIILWQNIFKFHFSLVGFNQQCPNVTFDAMCDPTIQLSMCHFKIWVNFSQNL